MYCHACECEHDDDYAGCVAIKTDDTVPSSSAVPFDDPSSDISPVYTKWEKDKYDLFTLSQSIHIPFEARDIAGFGFNDLTLPGIRRSSMQRMDLFLIPHKQLRDTVDQKILKKAHDVFRAYNNQLLSLRSLQFQTYHNTKDPEILKIMDAITELYTNQLPSSRDCSDAPSCQKTQHESQ